MVTKTNEEIEVMREQIATGKIPHNAIELYLKEEERHVFGVEVKHDRNGNPIEQGIGSAAQPSRNSIEAYKTFQMSNKFGPEAGFDQKLAKMEADLAAYQAKQKAAKAARV
jgi:hypothetical protein